MPPTPTGDIMKRCHRSAFSLYQLLVLMGLLSLGLAFLMPVLARLRLAAARNASTNNLKQIGLALHNYLDANNTLPPGTDDNHYSVAARILPYIEQDNLFKQIDFTKPSDDKANEQVRRTVIKVFLSPLDPREKVSADAGATNYLFSAGTKYTLEDNNGIFYHDAKVKLTDVSDGTSNTIWTAETLKGDGGKKALDVRRQHVALKAEALKELDENFGVKDWKDDKNIAGNRGAAWMDGRFLQGTFTATRSLNDPKPDVDCGGKGGLSGPRNLHPFINVGLCDGSVRSLSPKMTFQIWQGLITRNGGEVLGKDF